MSDEKHNTIEPAVLIDLSEHGATYDADLERIEALFEGMRADAKVAREAQNKGADRGAERPSPWPRVQIDDRRTSRALMVNGPRGSGKSTLLLLALKR